MFPITAKTHLDAKKYAQKWGLTEEQRLELEDLLDQHFERGIDRGITVRRVHTEPSAHGRRIVEEK